MRRLASTYVRIGRTYWSWAPGLLLLAVIVFLPLGLLDAISTELDVQQLDLGSGVKIAALVAAIAALTATSLIGEVFYSGAVATALTHPEHERLPPLREIARELDYKRLIAVDLLYVLIVVVGLLLFFVPGALAFVWLGLAGPVVEIERRGVRASLRRSIELVRGRFWLVAGVLVPIELVGDGLGEAAAGEIHHLLGDTFLGSWLAETVANLLFSPIFAVAAVLLTLDLITEKDGTAPRLNPAPEPSRATA
ncbi:MAG TPA: YciC family protein [Solirubrobacterales bacterium]|nr:YciC family protein [Solirubrobacterales bacterium]